MQKLMSTSRCLTIFVVALFVSLVALLAPATAFAEEQSGREAYTFTVRIYAGNQGSIEGKALIEIPNVGYGERVNFNQGSVQLNDNSKYYVRGLRESGRDNDTSSVDPSFVVTKDIDYVISYGILGQDVAYTVRYVDTDGNELAPDEVFYGNVGDSPVIAYRYIEGYTPQAYNLTGELYDDPSQNVYTFVYEAVAVNPEEPVEVEEVEGGAAVVVPVGEEIADEANPAAAPEDIVDIRDNENPLSGALDGLLEGSSQILREAWAEIIGSVALLAAALAILILVIKRRKKESAYDSQH